MLDRKTGGRAWLGVVTVANSALKEMGDVYLATEERPVSGIRRIIGLGGRKRVGWKENIMVVATSHDVS